MARIKLNQAVMYKGEVTTISELAERGIIIFREVKNFGSKCRTAYFADIGDTLAGWEINKTAYLSRTGQKVEF